jgi:hypothetical protein
MCWSAAFCALEIDHGEVSDFALPAVDAALFSRWARCLEAFALVSGRRAQNWSSAGTRL